MAPSGWAIHEGEGEAALVDGCGAAADEEARCDEKDHTKDEICRKWSHGSRRKRGESGSETLGDFI